MADQTVIKKHVPPNAGGMEFGRIAATLLDSWPLIVVLLGIALLIGAYQAWVTPNVYGAAALIQIEGKSSGYAIAEASADFGGALGSGDLVETAKQIIQTNRIMDRALDEGEFEVSVTPVYLPQIGEPLSRYQPAGTLRAPPSFIRALVPGWAHYAWGGEVLVVDSFTVPNDMLGREFHIVTGENNTYRLMSNRRLLGEGRVGQLMELSQNPDSIFRLMVSKQIARPGTEFILQRISRTAAIGELRKSLVLMEKANNTQLLQIASYASYPELAANRVNAVARAYVRTNIEQLSEEADKRITFLNEQLPKLRTELEAAEGALAAYRAGSKSSQLSEQSEGLVTGLSAVESKISELEVQRADLAAVFTSAHPSIVSIDHRLGELRAKSRDLNQKMAGLPAEEAKLVQLTRNSKVSEATYELLLNKSQEIKVARAGTVGTMHIVDDAQSSPYPIAPNRFNIAMRYVLGALVLAIAFVLGRRQFRGTVERAEDLEVRLGIPPHASIPYSKEQADIEKLVRGSAGAVRLLCHTYPNDPAVESFRSLRTSAYFALMEKQSNVIAITGAMPAVGKTFSSANLAGVFADTGRRTLVIDCDLRKGRLHSSMGLASRSPGLSDVLVDEVPQADAIRSTYQKDLFVLTSGKLPPNPSELLGSHRFVELLEKLRKEFDFVVLDCPPVMNLADSVLVTQHAGATYIVVRAKQTTFNELTATMQRLEQSGVRANGFIFNGFTMDIGTYLRGGADYTYYRSSDKHYNRESPTV